MKTKIFLNANFSKYSTQAQDRDGKHYAMFLDEEKYVIYAYSTDKEIDEFIKVRKNIKLFVSSRKTIIFFRSLITIIFKRVDIVLTGKAFWKEYIYFILNKFINRGKNILVLVNQTPYLWFKFDLQIFNLIVKSSDNIIAISEKVSLSFEKKYGIKTIPLPLFYNISKQYSKEISNERKKIVAVGSMIDIKNPFLFADTAKQLPEYDFIWIGKGYYFDWIKEKIEKENITNLTLIPKLIQSELFVFLQTCNLFFFPSIHEGFPNVLVEAMSCGLPVVCYNSYGPDAVINGVTGIVLNNLYDAPEALRKILNNKNLYKKFSTNARNRAKEYDGKILVKSLEKIIDSV